MHRAGREQLHGLGHDRPSARWDEGALELEPVQVAPRRADVDVSYVALAWLPYRRVRYRAGGKSGVLDVPAY